MFFGKKQRELDKEITQAVNAAQSIDNSSVIKVKIDDKDRLYSPYSYSDDRLSSEFSDYIFDKAKQLRFSDNIKIDIHSAEALNAEDVAATVKKHYGASYTETKRELRRITTISLIMTIWGVIALTAMILLNHFLNNFYVSTITEIAAWVFIWEAVDFFFLQRPVIKAKLFLIQRIYTAEIEIHAIDADRNDLDANKGPLS